MDKKKMKLYESENFKCYAPEDHCLFCDKCKDLFWDYTNGPYLFFCDDGLTYPECRKKTNG